MSLNTFFNPKSVAVVGVSADESKLGAVVFKNLIDAGFEVNLYGVNPKLAFLLKLMLPQLLKTN